MPEVEILNWPPDFDPSALFLMARHFQGARNHHSETMRRVIQWPSLSLPSHPTPRTINLISSLPVPGTEQQQPRPDSGIPQFQELLTQLSDDYQQNVPDDTVVSHSDFPSSVSCLTNVIAGLPMVIVASADYIVS